MQQFNTLQQIYTLYQQGGLAALSPTQLVDFEFAAALAREADQSIDSFMTSPLNNVMAIRQSLLQNDYAFAILLMHQSGIKAENVLRFLKTVHDDKAVQFIARSAKKAGISSFNYIRSIITGGKRADAGLTQTQQDYIRLAAQYTDSTIDYVLASAAIPYISSSLDRWRTDLRARVGRQGALNTVSTGDLVGILFLIRSQLGIKFEHMYDYLLKVGQSEAAAYLKDSAQSAGVGVGQYIYSLFPPKGQKAIDEFLEYERKNPGDRYRNFIQPAITGITLGLPPTIPRTLIDKYEDVLSALFDTSFWYNIAHEPPHFEEQRTALQLPTEPFNKPIEQELRSAFVTLPPIEGAQRLTQNVEGGNLISSYNITETMAYVNIPESVYNKYRGRGFFQAGSHIVPLKQKAKKSKKFSGGTGGYEVDAAQYEAIRRYFDQNDKDDIDKFQREVQRGQYGKPEVPTAPKSRQKQLADIETGEGAPPMNLFDIEDLTPQQIKARAEQVGIDAAQRLMNLGDYVPPIVAPSLPPNLGGLPTGIPNRPQPYIQQPYFRTGYHHIDPIPTMGMSPATLEDTLGGQFSNFQRPRQNIPPNAIRDIVSPYRFIAPPAQEILGGQPLNPYPNYPPYASSSAPGSFSSSAPSSISSISSDDFEAFQEFKRGLGLITNDRAPYSDDFALFEDFRRQVNPLRQIPIPSLPLPNAPETIRFDRAPGPLFPGVSAAPRYLNAPPSLIGTREGQIITNTDTYEKWLLLQNQLQGQQQAGNIAAREGEDPFISDAVKIRKSILENPSPSYSVQDGRLRGLVPGIEPYIVMGEYVM